MKKPGFTLAEVLITLGIIGVVAALTAPALVTSSKNEANAAKLAVVVSNLENAFTTAIAQEGVQDVFHTQMWTHPGIINVGSTPANKRIFAGELGRYMVINGVRANTEDELYNYYGSDGEGDARRLNVYRLGNNGERGERIGGRSWFVNFVPIELKNGAVMFIRTFSPAGGNGARPPIDEATAIDRGTALRANAADIIIDVNGGSAPNTVGRDIFSFYLGQNGILYPSGGADVAAFENHFNEGEVLDWRSPNSAQCACLPESNIVANEGWGCTGRLIAENYKMNY